MLDPAGDGEDGDAPGFPAVVVPGTRFCPQKRGFVPHSGSVGDLRGRVQGDFCNGAASKRGFLGLPWKKSPFVLLFVGLQVVLGSLWDQFPLPRAQEHAQDPKFLG